MYRNTLREDTERYSIQGSSEEEEEEEDGIRARDGRPSQHLRKSRVMRSMV